MLSDKNIIASEAKIENNLFSFHINTMVLMEEWEINAG